MDPTDVPANVASRRLFLPVVGATITLPWLVRYGVAAAVAAATVVLMALHSWLTSRPAGAFPFLICMPAIMLSGWIGGWGPGVLATIICAAGADYWLLQPQGTWEVADKGDLVGVLLLGAVGAVISILNEAWRRGISASARSEEQLSMALRREREAHADLKRTAAELRDLQSILDTALSSQNSDALFRALLGRLRAALHADTSSLLLVDAHGHDLVPVAANGLETNEVGEIRVPIGHGVAGRIALGDGPIIFDDLSREVVISPVLRNQVRSIIGTALKSSSGRLVGVVYAGSATQRRFTNAEVRLLSLAAERMGLAIDRARLHEAEQAARLAAETAAQELERVLEVIPTAVWIAKDPDCRQIVGNRSAAALLGVPPDQNVSQTPAPGDRPVSLRHFRDGRELAPDELPMQRAVATGSPQAFEELDIELPDGQRITMLGGATPLMDKHGRARGAVAAFTDVSERVKARRALEAADRQKDEFLALLGHELRNPLAPIETASELLSRTLPADSRAQLAIDIIKRQVSHLARLVDDLLDIGRITQGRIRLQQVPLELSTVIAQAVEAVEPRLRQKQHDLSVARSETPLFVYGDFTRLVQCISNVLANAVKYTEPRGKIRIESRAEATTAIISVADSGAGIAPELLPRVFDLFVQGDRTLDRAEGGLGIGLSVVKRLVQMHGGEVAAESRGLGTGTTIEIRLPRIEQPAQSKSAGVTMNVCPRRVLIVDDNADAAQSLSMLLRTAGHQTAVALGARQALETVESFRPEVALLDIGLPEINGYELARRLRANVKLNGLRLVAVTGYGQAEDRQRTRAAGFDHHLVKPVDFVALERALAGSCA